MLNVCIILKEFIVVMSYFDDNKGLKDGLLSEESNKSFDETVQSQVTETVSKAIERVKQGDFDDDQVLKDIENHMKNSALDTEKELSSDKIENGMLLVKYRHCLRDIPISEALPITNYCTKCLPKPEVEEEDKDANASIDTL